jgi:hypothetical protein
MNDTSPAAEIPASSATLLDYFAARAPRDIPAWFMPEADPFDGPAKPQIPADATDADANMLRSWVNDGIFDLPPNLAWFEAETDRHEKSKRLHLERYHMERFTQWPWVYADIMLTDRELYLTQDNKIVREEAAPPPLDEAGQEVVRKGLTAAVDAAKALNPSFDADTQPGVDLLHALVRFAHDCRRLPF